MRNRPKLPNTKLNEQIATRTHGFRDIVASNSSHEPARLIEQPYTRYQLVSEVAYLLGMSQLSLQAGGCTNLLPVTTGAPHM